MSEPPNRVHKHPQCGIKLSHSQGRKGCRVPSVPISCPCSIPAVPPTPVPAVLPLCAHLGLEMSLEGPGPPSAPCPTLDVSPAQPFPFSSPKGPAEKEQSRAEGRAPQSPQPKLASAQSKTGASKPSPAPSRARNACPTQPGASGQTEQNKPNHAFHKINPLLLFL